jgi:ABC-type branched-subunit amino acid transport system ATPase component
VLTLEGIVAGYGGSHVLHGVDLHCEPGSITCIVGPNGAGKSTVLRVVSGLLAPVEGTVTLDGTSIGGRAPDAVLRAGIAQVPQTHALFPQMTVRENVLLGGFTIRRNRDLLQQRFREVSELVPIVADRSEQHAGNLSGGQRRMVEVARCLMLQPAVLLLDEPSLGLDPKAVSSVVALVRDLNSDGMTVLLVEQNVRMGLQMASHGVVMEGGRVRLTGTAEEVRTNPEIASLFLGGHAAPAATTQPAQSTEPVEPTVPAQPV